MRVRDGEEGGGRTRRKRKKEREAKGRWECLGGSVSSTNDSGRQN